MTDLIFRVITYLQFERLSLLGQGGGQTEVGVFDVARLGERPLLVAASPVAGVEADGAPREVAEGVQTVGALSHGPECHFPAWTQHISLSSSPLSIHYHLVS